MERIVENLLDNALKYGGRDEAAPHIVVRVNANDARVQVAVEDNGRGVEANERKRIFELFYRARFDDF